jgi:hypothetical protein
MYRECSDILDRASIAKLKSQKIGLEENKREWEAFNKELNILIDKHQTTPILMFFDLLYKINSMIWELEFDLRKGSLDGALSEVGRRAIEIREHNNLRVQTKNIINILLNEGFLDIKRDHISSNE